MKGIVLAGGTGSRLWPATLSVSKQLIPIYDKPLIYYPLSILLQAGIREILIITTLESRDLFEDLLGDGSRFGVRIEYAVQTEPKGIAEALVIGKDFIQGDSLCLILGDNIFYGAGLSKLITDELQISKARIFLSVVDNPSAYGIAEIGDQGKIESLVEKPVSTKSKYAITGMYLLSNDAIGVAVDVMPSDRGELEIVDVLNAYLENQKLEYRIFEDGVVWMDAGTPKALHEASSFVLAYEERTGKKIACIEEIAFRNGWISKNDVLAIAKKFHNSLYGKYLARIVDDEK